MSEALIIGIIALATSIGGVIKQFSDNKKLKDWICTKNPCNDRIQKPEP